MGMFCVNKSGRAYNVYDSTNTENKIGVIYHNECFAYTKRWAGSHTIEPDALDAVHFLSSSGLRGGWIVNKGDGVETSILNYSFGDVVVDGITYKSLKTRRALTYYDSEGHRKGTCKAGVRVLTNYSTPGQTMPYLMNAMYVETGVGTNRWIICSGIPGQYGFIDTGLSGGSDASRIGIYGNW